MSTQSDFVDNDLDINAKSPLENFKNQVLENRKDKIRQGVLDLLKPEPKSVKFNFVYQVIYNFTTENQQIVKGLLEETFMNYLEKTFNAIDKDNFLDSFCDIWSNYTLGLTHIKKIFDFYV